MDILVDMISLNSSTKMNNNMELKEILDSISKISRRVIDQWMKDELDSDLSSDALKQWTDLKGDIPMLKKRLKRLLERIKLTEHRSMIIKNILLRLEEVDNWSDSKDNHINFLVKSYGRFLGEIFRIMPEDIKALKIHDVKRSMYTPVIPSLEIDEFMKLLFRFADTLFKELNLDIPKGFRELKIKRVDWTHGMYRENENAMYVYSGSESFSTLETIGHEFGHHVHAYMMKASYEKKRFTDEYYIYTPYIDFSIVLSEGVAMYFVELFAEYLKRNYNVQLGEGLLVANDDYIQYCVRRGVLSNEFFTSADDFKSRKKRFIESVATDKRKALIEFYNMLSNPGYKECYPLGYWAVKKLGLKKLTELGYISFDEAAQL